jgi:kumamolisin
MKLPKCLLATAVAVPLLGYSTLTTFAQHHVFIPGSSLPQPRDADGHVMARTHLRILAASPTQMPFGAAAVGPQELPPFPGYLFETPASLACIYKLVPVTVPGCNPNLTTANPTGGSHAIAVIEAFDDPTAASDLATFSTQFGLSAADLTVVYSNGTEPGIDPTGGWEIEESLDMQWAHAMAPEAKIFLIEAATNTFGNLSIAWQVGANLVAAAGGGEVSMGFGAPESELSPAFEAFFDPTFTKPGVVYFAAAGDSPGTDYPSVSPNVVSAGGTSISRNTTTGDFFLESTWQEAGGGPSLFEPRPAFQNGVKYIVGNARGTPDFSFDSNPTSGVWVFDTNPNPALGTGWFIVGGTSVASPSLAGIVNSANKFHTSSQAENQALYGDIGTDRVNDIFYGNCGINISNYAGFGWDFCTGVGSDRNLKGK